MLTICKALFPVLYPYYVFIITAALLGKYVCYPHFIDESAQTRKG